MSQQFYQNPSSSGMNDGGQNGLYQFPNAYNNPAMLNMTATMIDNVLREQGKKYQPGASDFWNNLKIYFAVSNSYVLKKMSIVLYPMAMRNQSWGRLRAEEAAESGESVRQQLRTTSDLSSIIV
jgi:YIF1